MQCQAPWHILVGGGAPSTDTPAHCPWTALFERWQWTGQKSKVGEGGGGGEGEGRVGSKMVCCSG